MIPGFDVANTILLRNNIDVVFGGVTFSTINKAAQVVQSETGAAKDVFTRPEAIKIILKNF